MFWNQGIDIEETVLIFRAGRLTVACLEWQKKNIKWKLNFEIKNDIKNNYLMSWYAGWSDILS